MHSRQNAQALWDDRCIFCCQTGGIVAENYYYNLAGFHGPPTAQVERAQLCGESVRPKGNANSCSP